MSSLDVLDPLLQLGILFRCVFCIPSLNASPIHRRAPPVVNGVHLRRGLCPCRVVRLPPCSSTRTQSGRLHPAATWRGVPVCLPVGDPSALCLDVRSGVGVCREHGHAERTQRRSCVRVSGRRTARQAVLPLLDVRWNSVSSKK